MAFLNSDKFNKPSLSISSILNIRYIDTNPLAPLVPNLFLILYTIISTYFVEVDDFDT